MMTTHNQQNQVGIRERFWIKILGVALRRLDARKVTVDYDSILDVTMIWIFWKEIK
jgi:hypothetical protein